MVKFDFIFFNNEHRDRSLYCGRKALAGFSWNSVISDRVRGGYLLITKSRWVIKEKTYSKLSTLSCLDLPLISQLSRQGYTEMPFLLKSATITVGFFVKTLSK